MRPVFLIADNILSPIGQTSTENFRQLVAGMSGIQIHQKSFAGDPFYASLFRDDAAFSTVVRDAARFTRFEQLLIASVTDALSAAPINPADGRTALIVSTTKGNIALIEQGIPDQAVKQQATLYHSAKQVAGYFRFTSQPVVVSHACISGLVALITGMRLINSGRFDHAVVAGADLITQFVLSGFQSFHAVSDAPCRPFDADRNGITLGEAAATIILSATKPDAANPVQISGAAVSNDANHISGPSRTGQELHQAIELAIAEAAAEKRSIDFISAHGTATRYNDEMEAKAFTLSGLQQVPVNSLKGFYGHTLGAAGLVETVASVHSLHSNTILPTPGYATPGTSVPVNINNVVQTGSYHCCLKTASGFGGCNAAVVLQKTG